MNYSSLYENKKRGTIDFPIELYSLNSASPRYQMPFHWHLEYELILITSGSFELSLDGKAFPMQAADCAWVGSGVIHGGIPEDCIYECVVFDLGTLLHDTLYPDKAESMPPIVGLIQGKPCLVSPVVISVRSLPAQHKNPVPLRIRHLGIIIGIIGKAVL